MRAHLSEPSHSLQPNYINGSSRQTAPGRDEHSPRRGPGVRSQPRWRLMDSRPSCRSSPMSVLLQQRFQCPLGFSNGPKHLSGEISADGSRYVPLEQRALYAPELKLVRMIPDCEIENGKTSMDAFTEDVLCNQ